MRDDGTYQPSVSADIAADGKYHWTGETKWASDYLPAFCNEERKVYRKRAPAKEMSEYGDFEGIVHAHIKGELTTDDRELIGNLHGLKTLELSKTDMPSQWDSNLLANAPLRHLSFNNVTAFEGTEDMQGLASKPSLQSLGMVRADFMTANEGEPFRHLAQMDQLRELTLDRTITREHAPGEAEYIETPDGRMVRQVVHLNPLIVDSLVRLIEHGSLQKMSPHWCTALSESDIARLQAAAARTGCEIILP